MIALARGFDVYSMNKYRWAPPKDFIDRVYAIQKLPILIGEFHFGVPERGLAPGLVQAMNQAERGVAYSYYVEHAAAHPAIVGTHWYQWIDQPATGRRDGENYNIGWIDVTDRPYPELVAAAKATHAQARRHPFGKARGRPRASRRPRSSERRRIRSTWGYRRSSRAVLAPMERNPPRSHARALAIGKQGSRGPRHRRQPE